MEHQVFVTKEKKIFLDVFQKEKFKVRDSLLLTDYQSSINFYFSLDFRIKV